MILCLHRSKQSLSNLHVHVSLNSMTCIKNCELLPNQCFLFKIRRLIQRESFFFSSCAAESEVRLISILNYTIPSIEITTDKLLMFREVFEK